MWMQMNNGKISILRGVWSTLISRDKCGPVQWTTSMSQEIEVDVLIQKYNYQCKLGGRCEYKFEKLQDIHLKRSVDRTVWISRDKCGPVRWTTPMSQEIQGDFLILLSTSFSTITTGQWNCTYFDMNQSKYKDADINWNIISFFKLQLVLLCCRTMIGK